MNTAETRHASGASKYVVIGDGKYLVVQVLLALRTFTDADCLVVCAPGTRFLRHSTLVSDYLEAGLGGADDDAIIERIHRFAGHTVDVVIIPADCLAARWINRVRTKLAISVMPTPDNAMLDRFDDKWRFYQFCLAYELRVPPTVYAVDKHQLGFAATATTLGLPFIVKPVNGQASIGTRVVESEESYRRQIADNSAYRHSPLIAQRYIAGKDVGINLLAIGGRLEAVAIQRRIDPTHDGSRVEFFAHAELEDIARTIVRAGRYTGVMNIDARIEDGSEAVYLLESNPRFWRSLSASTWCGLNFLEKCIVQPQAHSVTTLTAGSADTYYHPLFRPVLWKHALFDKSDRGRMVRVMLPEVCTLAMSTRILGARARNAFRRFLHGMAHAHGSPPSASAVEPNIMTNIS